MKSRKTVLFLANHFITLFSFRKEIIQEMLAKGYDVILSLPDSPENIYFINWGCRVVSTPIDRRGLNPISDLKLFLRYIQIIKRERPDIIFSFTIKPNIYGALACRFMRSKQICNITGTGGTFLKKSLIASLCKLLYKISVRRSHKVFFQNSGDRDFFIRNKMVGRDNYSILPGSGCNLDQHSFSLLPEGDVINFVFIGRVMKLKGIDEFLTCANFIHAKYPNTTFSIAGWIEEKEYENRIKQAERNGSVKYLGFRKDIDVLIKNTHCTILASYGGEGVPNVLLETAANGRICIASRINGSKDVIEDNVTGYLFNPGDSDDLISKVEKVIHLTPKERARMGANGRKKIEREFDRKIVIKAYLNEVAKA